MSPFDSCLATAAGDGGDRDTGSQNGAGVIEPRHRNGPWQNLAWEQQRYSRPSASGHDSEVGRMLRASAKRETVRCDAESAQSRDGSPEAWLWFRPSERGPTEQKQRGGGYPADGNEQSEAS